LSRRGGRARRYQEYQRLREPTAVLPTTHPRSHSTARITAIQINHTPAFTAMPTPNSSAISRSNRMAASMEPPLVAYPNDAHNAARSNERAGERQRRQLGSAPPSVVSWPTARTLRPRLKISSWPVRSDWNAIVELLPAQVGATSADG